MAKVLFVEYCAKDYLDGTLNMEPLTELAYRRITDMITSTNDKLLDNNTLKYSTKTGNKWKKIRQELIDMGKIYIEGGYIRNKKCTEKLQKSRHQIEQKSIAGKASAEARKSLENNKTGSTAVATPVPTAEPTNQKPNNQSSKYNIIKDQIYEIIKNQKGLRIHQVHELVKSKLVEVGVSEGYTSVPEYYPYKDSKHRIDVVWLHDNKPLFAFEIDQTFYPKSIKKIEDLSPENKYIITIGKNYSKIEDKKSALPPDFHHIHFYSDASKKSGKNSAEFEEFWKHCPRKSGKKEAGRKYWIAREEISAEDLLKAIKRHRREMADTEKQFIPMPATWLHQGRYYDEPSMPDPEPIDEWPNWKHALANEIGQHNVKSWFTDVQRLDGVIKVKRRFQRDKIQNEFSIAMEKVFGKPHEVELQ